MSAVLSSREATPSTGGRRMVFEDQVTKEASRKWSARSALARLIRSAWTAVATHPAALFLAREIEDEFNATCATTLVVSSRGYRAFSSRIQARDIGKANNCQNQGLSPLQTCASATRDSRKTK